MAEEQHELQEHFLSHVATELHHAAEAAGTSQRDVRPGRPGPRAPETTSKVEAVETRRHGTGFRVQGHFREPGSCPPVKCP